MKKTLLKTAVLTVIAVGMATALQAANIVGGISQAGNVTFNTGNINTATTATFNNVQVTSIAGSYVGQGILINTPGSVTYPNTPLQFNPFVANVPLWTLATAGGTASFDLTTLTQRLQPGDNTLTLRGTGVLHMTGFTDTLGDWIFTANSLGGTFSFSASNSALGLPDGGTTAILLGAALSGLALLRRKLG
jgi:hypothetical protein